MTDITQQPQDEYRKRRALAALPLIERDIQRLEEIRITAIIEARGEGCTWGEIAESLGLPSRQFAERRYGKLVRSRNVSKGE